jgi:hypothetical protein
VQWNRHSHKFTAYLSSLFVFPLQTAPHIYWKTSVLSVP